MISKNEKAENKIKKRRALTNDEVKHKNYFEQIQNYYQKFGAVALPLEVDAVRVRIESAYKMYLNDKEVALSKMATCRKHSRLWKQTEMQSWRDVQAGLELFGQSTRSTRDTHRAVAIEMALKTYKKAEISGEIGEMNRATKIYSDITGIEKDDPNVPKAEDFRIPVAEVMDEFTRTLLQKIAEKATQGNTLDLLELKVVDLIEGIDFEVLDSIIFNKNAENDSDNK